MNLQSLPYPHELEAWWLRKACGERAGSNVEAELERYVPIVDRLSGLFTTERKAAFGRYVEDRNLLLAYGLFYYPQTFTRIQFPLRELLSRKLWRPGPAPMRVLDLGTGSGAALTGLVEVLQAEGANAIEAHGIDQSEKALALAAGLAADLAVRWPRTQWTFTRGNLADPATWPKGSWNLMVASFALNEVFHERPAEALTAWIQTALERLSGDGVLLLVEPALRESSERLEELRDWAAGQRNIRILAPCLHSAECPLRAGKEFWCHEVREWTRPASLTYLNRRLYRAITQVKFSFLAVSHAMAAQPQGENFAGPSRFRLISPIIEKKGRLIATGCAADGNRNTYEWQTRNLTKNQIKALTQIERGEVLQTDKIDIKGAVLRVSGETKIHKVQR